MYNDNNDNTNDNNDNTIITLLIVLIIAIDIALGAGVGKTAAGSRAGPAAPLAESARSRAEITRSARES